MPHDLPSRSAGAFGVHPAAEIGEGFVRPLPRRRFGRRAGALLGRAPRVAEIEALKLASPLRPGQRFRVHTRISAGAKVELTLCSEAVTHATGRVRLEELEETPS